MALAASDLVPYKPADTTDTDSHGGRLSANAYPASGSLRNIFQDVPQSVLTAGGNIYRKVFWKNKNIDGISLQEAKLYLARRLLSDIRARYFAGTETDTRADISSPRLYGGGRLQTAITAGDSVIYVTVRDGNADGIIQAGDTIAITDQATTTDGTGHTEFHDVLSVSWGGDVATITLDGTTVANDYALSRSVGSDTIYTHIASCPVKADVVATAGSYTPTTTSGTYDDVSNPVEPDNIGTVYQTWTVTFSSATAFSVVGDTIGSVGSGNTSSDFAPNNASLSRPYFTIPAAFWGGTWASGETLQFTTGTSTFPIWYHLDVPAATSPVALENYLMRITGNAGSA